MHAVEFHFEGREAGALALACFQRQQKFITVVLNVAQFIQFGMIAVINHAAVAQPHGRLGQDGGLQLLGNGQSGGEHGLQGVQQRGRALGQFDFICQQQQAVAQGG